MPPEPIFPSHAQASLDETLDAASAEVPVLAPANAESARISQRLGRFVLLRELGAGGMGTVFVAYDEQLDRKVAVKLLHPREVEQTTQRQRVLREAQAMARISHQNVVHVYDVGELESQVFMAMEYVEGTTLADWQKTNPRRWQETLAMYRQAGKGLLAAHQTGLVHRDFKPENVLVDREGLARVADFGLARLQGEAVPQESASPERSASPVLKSPLTATGTLSGTPGYMSPEQFRCELADSRSDQFSFCVALYEALYQQRPFSGESITEVAAEVMAGRLRPLPPRSPVPIEVSRALSRGLAVDPSARFPTMAELLAAIDVDGERDPAGAAAARLRMSSVLIAVTLLLSGLGFLRSAPTKLTMPMLTAIMGLVAAIFIGGIVGFRKTLLANAFHRGLTFLTLSGVLTALAVRAMAWHMGIDILMFYPVDLLVLAGTCAAISMQYLRRLWGFAPMMVLASLLTAFWPQYAHRIANIAYTLLPISFIYGWYLMANQAADSAPT